MIQYLINVTLIWAICLAAYEVLLKRHTYHQWNRVFLLLSVAAGLLIPLISVSEQTIRTVSRPVSAGVRQWMMIKHAAVTTAAPSPIPVHDTITAAAPVISWVLVLYLAGVALAIGLQAGELLQIIRAYKSGTKTKHGRSCIIRIQKDTDPYSFFNLIFISVRRNYSENELEMILQHELRHAAKRHSADLLFISLVQIACWFHPLIYLFRQRLRLIHEYQADEVARHQYTTYGTFLLEQSLLSAGAPSLAHSFHSSIKNRIIMLTKETSGKRQLARYLITIPMVVVFIIACTHISNGLPGKAGKPRRNQVTLIGGFEKFNGHTFEFSNQTMGFDFSGDKTAIRQITVPLYPLKMDGEEIYIRGYIQPAFKGGNDGFASFIVSANQQWFDKLADGAYDLSLPNLVVDKNGQLVYFSPPELIAAKDKEGLDHAKGTFNEVGQYLKSPAQAAEDLQRSMELVAGKVEETLEHSPSFVPGTLKKNEPVISVFSPGPMRIVVQYGRARFVKYMGGC